MSTTDIFCQMVRRRSLENDVALKAIVNENVLSPAIAILRQEIDSMIRVIFLLSRNIAERQKLIDALLSGERWRWPDKKAFIFDAEMVKFARTYEGWTKVAYEFGCAFVHLSQHHDHDLQNPLSKLADEERNLILQYLRCYHKAPDSDNPTLEELNSLMPLVMQKVSSNVDYYLEHLEQEDSPEIALGLNKKQADSLLHP